MVCRWWLFLSLQLNDNVWHIKVSCIYTLQLIMAMRLL